MKWLNLVICSAALLLSVSCSAKQASTSTKQLELPGANLSALVVNNSNGQIEVVGKKDADKIQADVVINGSNMDKLKLNLENKDGVATLNAFFEGQFLATGPQSVDIKLTLPERMKLEIKKPHKDGNITVSNLSSDVTIDNVNGNLNLSAIGGPIQVKNRDGEIAIRDVSSDVNIENVNGHLKVENVGGSANVELGDGSLDIDRVAKNVIIIQSGSGKVTVGEVKGKVTQSRK
ncbi:hypothetical protein ACFCP7_02010 [Paenibacillus elgii]